MLLKEIFLIRKYYFIWDGGWQVNFKFYLNKYFLNE